MAASRRPSSSASASPSRSSASGSWLVSFQPQSRFMTLEICFWLVAAPTPWSLLIKIVYIAWERRYHYYKHLWYYLTKCFARPAMSPAPESSPTNCSEAIDQRFYRRLRAGDIWRNFSKVVGHWKFTRDRLRSKQLNWSLFSAVDRKKLNLIQVWLLQKTFSQVFPGLGVTLGAYDCLSNSVP